MGANPYGAEFLYAETRTYHGRASQGAEQKETPDFPRRDVRKLPDDWNCRGR